MNEYRPDKWIVISVIGEDIDKVLGSWYGGYLNGSSWRMSSGITEMIEEGEYYVFKNLSGSVYYCHKETQGISATVASIYDQIKSRVNIVEDFSLLCCNTA